MPTTTNFLDAILDEIKGILHLCRVGTASINIHFLRKTSLESPIVTESESKTFVASGEGGEPNYIDSQDDNKLYHIASITKILIAVALFLAIEVKAEENFANNPYAKFRGVTEKPLRWIYNKNRGDKEEMKDLPGDPTIYQLLTHNRGFRSSNHRLVGFDGTPILMLANVLNDLVNSTKHNVTDPKTENVRTEYSNINYCVVVIFIEALWGKTIDDFMNETLFKPLRMTSTSIGFPYGRDTNENYGWLVDSDERRHRIQRPLYQVPGAEAGPLGGFSTTRDLIKFFTFILNSYLDKEVLPGFTRVLADQLFELESEDANKFLYTALGLFARLDSEGIGALSINRLQFPNKSCSTYPVHTGPQGGYRDVFYMAGSAIGCTCATAMHINKHSGGFAIVVLTDTSGPVDPADHILKLILRHIVDPLHPKQSTGSISRSKSVFERAQDGKRKSVSRWKEMIKEDQRLRQKAPKDTPDIFATFEGVGFHQKLTISKGADQKTYASVGNTSTTRESEPFELIWGKSSSFLKVCIPPYKLMDRLGAGDWSNLIFKVSEQKDGVVMELERETATGTDRYRRGDSSV